MANAHEADFVEDILTLLSKAKPVARDRNLERIAKLCDPETEASARSRGSHGNNTWLAINKLRMELDAGLTEDRALPLWRDCVEAANNWLNALK